MFRTFSKFGPPQPPQPQPKEEEGWGIEEEEFGEDPLSGDFMAMIQHM